MFFSVQTQFGPFWVTVSSDGQTVEALSWNDPTGNTGCNSPTGEQRQHSLSANVIRQAISTFFDTGDDSALREIPLQWRGTPFQQNVWKAAQALLPGETATYAEVAARIGNPKSMQAVGQALKVNPFLVIVPCHRVVAKSGLGGYMGHLQHPVKQGLLALEGAWKQQQQPFGCTV